MAQGYVYYRKGDLSLALQNYKLCVESTDGKSKIFELIASESYRGMGNIYSLKGDFNKSLKFFEKSLNISIESAWFSNMAWVYLNIIKLLLDNNNIQQAHKYLNYFKQFKEKADHTQVNSLYELSKARILKRSGKIRDLAKAEENLKKILDYEVHDLVDLVTAEAKRAGLNAVEYVKERFSKKVEKKEQIICSAGENVNYIKPDLINISELSKDIIFTFRVKRPDRRILIQFKDDNNKIIYKRKRKYVIPSEMIELKLNLNELKIDSKSKSLEVEVIPRPEALIEED